MKGAFGTITFGDAPTVADDIGYVYVHDDLVGEMGAGAMDYGELLDGDFPVGGGNFYSINATYLAGLTNQDTRIKYTSPMFGGVNFAVDFTPVVGGAGHAGNGGRNDLFDDDQTYYENVVTAGVNYQDTFGDWSVRAAATAAYGHGIQTSDAGQNPHGNDLEVYTLGGQVGYQGIHASVNWTHNESIAAADKPVDSDRQRYQLPVGLVSGVAVLRLHLGGQGQRPGLGIHQRRGPEGQPHPRRELHLYAGAGPEHLCRGDLREAELPPGQRFRERQPDHRRHPRLLSRGRHMSPWPQVARGMCGAASRGSRPVRRGSGLRTSRWA